MKLGVSIAVACVFFLVGVDILTHTASTVAKALVDTSLPANYSFFATFAHYATPSDWMYVFLSAMVVLIGCLLSFAILRTKWLPD